MSEIKKPSAAELDRMSEDELLELGTKLDGVEIAQREPRWPEEIKTRAEKRAERGVTFWLSLIHI